VVRVQVLLRIVLELEQAALPAEPVGLAVVLVRQQRGRRVDLHAADGIDLGRHRCVFHGYSPRMDDLDPVAVRATLDAERSRLIAELGEEIRAPGQMTYGSQAAAASQVFEQQRDLALRDRASQQLALVDAAIERL